VTDERSTEECNIKWDMCIPVQALNPGEFGKCCNPGEDGIRGDLTKASVTSRTSMRVVITFAIDATIRWLERELNVVKGNLIMAGFMEIRVGA
jgi:hypothetical protein